MGRVPAGEAARRLGVKVETVYAYASRGLLSSERAPGGRGTTFDVQQIEELAESGLRRRVAASSAFRFATVRTSLTLHAEGQLYYRGRSTVAMSRAVPFEGAVTWLWSGTLEGTGASAGKEQRAVVRRAMGALSPSAGPATRQRVAVGAAAGLDPLRFDLSHSGVTACGRRILAVLVAALGGPARGTVAQQLAAALAARAHRADCVPHLDAALCLLADHGLAASTIAARVAASTRANPYAVVAAGLAALDGPLHGGASSSAYDVLAEVVAGGDVRSIVARCLRDGGRVPGFGHVLETSDGAYPDGDPRAVELLARLRRWDAAAPALGAVRRLRTTLRSPTSARPNVDLALAALMLSAGMPRAAGEAVVAVARTAGWIAHALEEYEEEPLRWRGRETYLGPMPDR